MMGDMSKTSRTTMAAPDSRTDADSGVASAPLSPAGQTQALPAAAKAIDAELQQALAQAALLAQARHPDPFSYLGRHVHGAAVELRVYWPYTQALRLHDGAELQRVADTDLFILRAPAAAIPLQPHLLRIDGQGNEQQSYDVYSFPSLLGDFDRQVFGEGHHWHAYRFLGAHPRRCEGLDGVHFALWAPHAERVSVLGGFNRWDGRVHPMRRHPGGFWDLFLPGLTAGEYYKFELRTAAGHVLTKTDPYAQACELRPGTAGIVTAPSRYAWRDRPWLDARAASDWQHAPMSVYEVHLGSWKRHPDGRFWTYRELAEDLPAYVRSLGFSHIELLPVMEHPYDPSWGYQTVGNFAPTSRFGGPDDFRYFVDACHDVGLGVLLDWVPAHFPKDAHGLARFDGTALYEHEDPRRGEHPDWDTLIYDYGRPQVRNYLLSSALYWLEEFHIDGLRVDAVASMLYLDYSRRAGDWLPNRYGGRENIEAIEFLRELNSVVHSRHPGALVIAEESTDWPQVTRPAYVGGLGFSMKWDMGWMHDTLDYLKRDSVHRQFHHERLTFGMLYRYSENYVLALSHDEVVHMKRSLLYKMSGDRWQQFANLRLLYTYQFTFPGKKLLFMGSEFAQSSEWDHDRELDWWLLQYPEHAGVQALLRDLNRWYCSEPSLHRHDFEPGGFEWIDCHDATQSVLSYLRRDAERCMVLVLNFTPVPRRGYRIGLPHGGIWHEVLNSDSAYYGGSNLGNGAGLQAEPVPCMGRPYSIELTLPPLAGLMLQPG